MYIKRIVHSNGVILSSTKNENSVIIYSPSSPNRCEFLSSA